MLQIHQLLSSTHRELTRIIGGGGRQLSFV